MGSLSDAELANRLLREQYRRITTEFHLQRALHDLANDFHAIELRVSFMESKHKDDSGEDQSLLTEVLQSCTIARGRISSLVEVSSTAPTTSDRVALLPIITQAAELAREDGGTVTLAPELAAMPPIKGDAAELAVMFVHLFDNAREAGGSLQVEGALIEQQVMVRISDDGPGLPKEAGVKIWKPFFTTKGSTHRGHGLPLSQRVLRRCGGSIEAQAGPGACFLLKFSV